MKFSKIISVVLTVMLSSTILLNYIVATKFLVNVSKVSTFVMAQENNEKIITETASTTTLTKETTKNNRKSVTSRSGKHIPINELSKVIIPNDTTTIAEEKVEETPIEEPVVEEVIPAKPTFEGVELEYSAAYNITSAHLTKSKGAIYYNGHKETYYSQRVLPGKGLKMLNNNGRHVANDGTVRDGDGFIAIACNYLPKGSTIMTSLGPGKVYDTGGMTGKWIDIYVNW